MAYLILLHKAEPRPKLSTVSARLAASLTRRPSPPQGPPHCDKAGGAETFSAISYCVVVRSQAFRSELNLNLGSTTS